MTNDQPTKQPASQPPPPLQAFLVAWPLRGGEARQLFNQPPAPASWHRAPLTRETPQGRKCLKTPRPAPHLLTRPIARGPTLYKRSKPHVAVHLRLLRPFRHPPYVPQALLLALAGEHSRGGNLNPTDFHHRIRILCWCTTSTSPIRTTTRCWSPTPCPSGARRRSGPRRNSSPS